MKWMKERDLLIAQTMAFVQSVSGKIPEADKPVAASIAEPPVAEIETAGPALPTSEIAPSQIETPAAADEPATVPVQPVQLVAETLREMPRPVPAPFVRPEQPDFQTEIRARVANFRAHQERFSREREAYCTATMAKVHATLKEGELPPPRVSK